MKKRKRQSGIHIHLTNRWLYTFIAIGILIAVGIGVYAATYSPSGAGHPYTEISTCGANQVLQMNSAGTAWTCADLPAQPSIPSVTGALYGICMMRYRWVNPITSDVEEMNTQATLESTECTAIAAPATCGTSNYCTCSTGYTRQNLVTGTGVPQGYVTHDTAGYHYSTIFTFTCVKN